VIENLQRKRTWKAFQYLTHPASAGFLFGDKGSSSIAWFCRHRKPSALRAGNPLRVASRVGSCPTGCGGRGGGLRPSSLPLAARLSGFHQHQGCGFAHVLTRSHSLRSLALRLPGVPLTLLPAMTRATTNNERGNETVKTRRSLV